MRVAEVSTGASGREASRFENRAGCFLLVSQAISARYEARFAALDLTGYDGATRRPRLELAQWTPKCILRMAASVGARCRCERDGCDRDRAENLSIFFLCATDEENS